MWIPSDHLNVMLLKQDEKNKKYMFLVLNVYNKFWKYNQSNYYVIITKYAFYQRTLP